MRSIFSGVTVVTVTLFPPRILNEYPRKRPEVAYQTPFQKPFNDFYISGTSPRYIKMTERCLKEFRENFFQKNYPQLFSEYAVIKLVL